MGLFQILFGKREASTKEKPYVIKRIQDMTDEERAELKDQYERFTLMIKVQSDQMYRNEKEKADKANSKCPSCQSENVNDRVKRLQGEINGHGSSSVEGFGILGTGYMSGSSRSSIKGSMDTKPVNKCNDCQNEWHKVEPKYEWTSEYNVKEHIREFFKLCDKAHDYSASDFDINDLSHDFKSWQEAKAHKIATLASDWRVIVLKRYFSKYSLELVRYVYEKGDSYVMPWGLAKTHCLTDIVGIPKLQVKIKQDDTEQNS